MKISIIIPVYNKIRYIATILQQVKAQSFTDFECLIIDDGSSDGSGAVCDAFAAEDQRFRVFHIPNGGVSHARNVGLDAAQGEYITFIDADDEIAPQYLGTMYAQIVASAADIVICASRKFWDCHDRMEMIMVPYDGLVSNQRVFSDFAKIQYQSGIYGYCWGKLLKSEIAKSNQFHTGIRLAEDLEYYLSLYPQIQSFYFEATPLYYYRQEAENSSMLVSDSRIDYYTQLEIQMKLRSMLQSVGYLTEENKRLTTNRIYDYVYFALLHAAKDKTREYIKKMRKIALPSISVSDIFRRDWRQICILLLFVCRVDALLVLFKHIYHVLRKHKKR